MDNKIIEELIKSNTQTCPDFIFSNPLLDKTVAKALSKSFVSLLKLKNNQNGKTRIPKNSMLQTIRDLCKTAPEEHVEINEDLTELIASKYNNQLKELTTANADIDKQLDTFLIKKSKAMVLSSSYKSNVNPEVLQAMLNLKENVVFSVQISQDILYWNVHDQKTEAVLNNLWNEKTHEKSFYDNASIKMKTKIENILLNYLHQLLVDDDNNNEDIFSTENELKLLINASSISPECFQICIAILNTLFIETNFNITIQKFIVYFIQNVKFHIDDTISILYPFYLSILVTMLDIDLDQLPDILKESYILEAKYRLTMLHNSSENEFIMLLTHFPHWFNIYFSE